jgi:hypothetical protein
MKIGLGRARAHAVLTVTDTDNIIAGLKMYPGYKIYVGYNKHSILNGEKDEVKAIYSVFNVLSKYGYLTDIERKKMEAETKELVANKTAGNVKGGRVEIWPMGFHHFDEMITDFFEMFYRESQINNEVVINVSGSEIAAAGASAAASITLNSLPMCLIRNKNVEKGYAPCYIQPLFDVSYLFPPEREEEEMLLILGKGAKRTLSDILRSEGLKEKINMENSEQKEKRRIFAKYSYYLNKLENNGFVNIGRKEISLTSVGSIVSRLMEKKRKVDHEVKEIIKKSEEILLK